MNRILGIDEITYGVDSFDDCKTFFLDWGLKLVAESTHNLDFATLNGCLVKVRDQHDPSLTPAIEPGSTLRQVVWGVEDQMCLDRLRLSLQNEPGYGTTPNSVTCIDPNGLSIKFQISQKQNIDLTCGQMNTWSHQPRLNQPSPVYNRAEPIEVGHVVFFVEDVKLVEHFYIDKLGFVASDRYPNRGSFLRCDANGGHHDLFLLQTPNPKKGLNHVAFTVRDIHEVFGGGMHISRCGWKTQLGPGRHPISSAYFWYFNNPAGGLIEYYADEDQLNQDWQSREFEPGPTVFAEWAIDGGLDGNTRRQANAKGPDGAFLTDRK